MQNCDHDHSAWYFGSNARNQTLEWKGRLRVHVQKSHGHPADWARLPEIDLIAEQHNLDHGRDAFGVEL